MRPRLALWAAASLLGCHGARPTDATGSPAAPEARKPAFYRSAMNPADTSPGPKQDAMGMAFVPVFAEPTAPAAANHQPAFYRNPMNPADTSPVPKKDSMGMDYVPVYAQEPTGVAMPPGTSVVRIEAEQGRLIGLKTVLVQRADLDTTLRTTGEVLRDETRVVRVAPRFEGFIEKLYANFTGKFVKQGEALATIYSPELFSTEQEFLLAQRAQPMLSQAGLPGATESARARLRLFGISDAEIEAIARSGSPARSTPLAAPISGYITANNVVAGAKVGPGNPLFDIADLSHVWVQAAVYEYERPRIELGQSATLTLPYWPDRAWRGRVSYILPSVDEKTRTISVRIAVENPRLDLSLGMFADVVIASAPRQVVLIPEDAIIDSGTRKIVFVVLAKGELQPREIETGDQAHGMVEVRTGLEAGESVASGANFLLDSESRLKSAIGPTVGRGDGGD